ncbi:Oidioi.mRNA.OKI2018_I69.chr1.g1375.t1.cds [Oikopleura dioica]|uniref:Oidioi.mRNA.OKI2018_I69.chr1.g1375.t1.cds n=1 Tax=Oikopleura dioica TaxID=34765 RepID=A0ABN7SMQ2_OIKDI|nr:Oidioi.mRNA.OKI2018_I69.chr1.g1375.t1.cds [Oikopleura dioica]
MATTLAENQSQNRNMPEKTRFLPACITNVREQMARQMDGDIQRALIAGRLNNNVTRLDNALSLMKREAQSNGLLLGDLADDARKLNKRLDELLARDPRVLPREAIEAAKRGRNQWDL